MAKKSENKIELKGCRGCRYRVSPMKANGEREAACCFGYTVNDKKRPTECGELYTPGDYYFKHPEEP